MVLTLQQAAAHLGKTVRQVRYMIQEGKLRARKVQGRWMIDSADLPKSDGQKKRQERGPSM